MIELIEMMRHQFNRFNQFHRSVTYFFSFWRL